MLTKQSSSKQALIAGGILMSGRLKALNISLSFWPRTVLSRLKSRSRHHSLMST